MNSTEKFKAQILALPDAEELDTEHMREGSRRGMHLYLIPGDERPEGIPCVVTHEYVGARTTPMPAWNGRWSCIGHVGPQIVGASVRRLLESMAGDLITLSEAYAGTEWDGSNHVGTWSEAHDAIDDRISEAWDLGQGDLQEYWDASEWLSAGMTTWTELLELTGLPEDTGLDEQAAAVDSMALTDGVFLSRTIEALEELASEDPGC